jgi:putative ABC transport system permease protein
MFHSSHKYSLRVLNRQKGYFMINTVGLSLGIACSLIIALFIMHELSFDQFHEKKDRIYRLVVTGIIGDRQLNYAITSAPVGPTLLREFPEVEDFTRINIPAAPIIKYLDKKYIEDGFIESDSSFFNIFSIPLLRGNIKTVLTESHTLVISQSTARRLFGEADPMDQLIQVGKDRILYRVTGIMADIPENSHFDATMVGSFVTNPESRAEYWGNNNFATYILLKDNVNPVEVNAKMPDLIRRYMGELAQKSLGITVDEFIGTYKYNIHLQPIGEIHFNPSLIQVHPMKPAVNPKYMHIFGSIAILIIIIAAINFMNLSTAQASKRAKEVGIKKVSGSSKGMLVRQFLTESILLAFVSLALAVILIENTLPFFNNLLGAKLQLNLLSDWYMIPALLLLSILVGLLAGIYPAFYLSSFNPALVLKGRIRDSFRHGRLRSILVILQFSISIILIVGTLIMVRQIRFMLRKDLGFNTEQLMVITRAESVGNHVKAFKDALKRIPEVVMATSSTAVPGHSESGKTYTVEGTAGKVMDFKINYVDNDFFETYGIKLDSGRTFDASFSADYYAGVINESAIKELSLEDPFATRLVDAFEKVSVVGIVQNFHFESLHSRINPYIFRLKDDSTLYGYFSIRLSPAANAKTIREIEKVWNAFAPDDPIQFFFMDEDFAQKYKEERQNAQLSVIFSVLAIIIASLGLFGLTAFSIEQRTKEIGLRKSMGASVASVFLLITKEFMLLVAISTIISWPVVYVAAGNWLQNYYYRIDLNPIDFAAGFVIVVGIAVATISYKTLKSARTNPVDALRYE